MSVCTRRAGGHRDPLQDCERNVNFQGVIRLAPEGGKLILMVEQVFLLNLSIRQIDAQCTLKGREGAKMGREKFYV